MPIRNWSTTPASNNSAAPNGFPEGMAPAGLNDGMRQVMADVRTQCEDNPWFDFGDVPTRTGNTTFTVPTDKTTRYAVGKRIRCTDSSTIYGTISNVSYSAPNTTVTVTTDSGNLSASLTAVALTPFSSNQIPDDIITGRMIADDEVLFAHLDSTAIASQAEAEAGSATNKLMTPQRTSQAISVLAARGAFSDTILFNADTTITSSGLNKAYTFYGSTARTFTLPVMGSFDGTFTRVQNNASAGLSIARQTSGTIYYGDAKSSNTITVPPGYTAGITSDGSDWFVHISPSSRSSATAWVSFNGTGTLAIRDSYNVSSVSDIATGRYKANYANNFANANYCMVFGGHVLTDTTPMVFSPAPESVADLPSTSTSGELQCRRSSTGALVDVERLCLTIFGGVV